ncbi:MAG: NAD(P)H-dependent oxidoreductase [bacterium]
MQNIIDAYKWRYATKQYDTSKNLTAEQLDVLLKSIELSPTSYGLQAFKVFVVTNPEIRAKLRAAAWDQPQITDASHLIVFTVPTNLNESHIDTFIEKVSKTRNVSVESLAGYSGMMKGSISHKTPEQKTEWLARQVYIALGFLLSTAALEHIDATPMEGFDPKQFDEILGLTKENLTSVVIAPVGFRSEKDEYSKLTKVRFGREEIVHEVK